MKKSAIAFLVALAFGANTFAQSAQDSASQQDQGKDKKDKKKKKDNSAQDALNAEVFSDAIANSVLNDIRDGFEGHTQRLLLSAFDQDKMDGYLQFEDQIDMMFQRYSMFTVHFRIVQSSVEGPKGIVLVDFQMEEVPKGTNPNPIRKSSQIRVELERGKKGWKIVDINPRGFFS